MRTLKSRSEKMGVWLSSPQLHLEIHQGLADLLCFARSEELAVSFIESLDASYRDRIFVAAEVPRILMELKQLKERRLDWICSGGLGTPVRAKDKRIRADLARRMADNDELAGLLSRLIDIFQDAADSKASVSMSAD